MVCDAETGEMIPLQPEFALMSRRPGIAAGWFQKYGKEVYPHDAVIVRGRECKPPRYYDIALEKEDPVAMARVSRARQERANDEESSPNRLRVREECAHARLAFKRREI